MIIAKLIKDLPDVKAGAIFKSILKRHWELEGFEDKYTENHLFYFYDDEFTNTVDKDSSSHCVYHYIELKEWCLFFDYSCGEFKKLEEVTTLTISNMQEVPMFF